MAGIKRKMAEETATAEKTLTQTNQKHAKVQLNDRNDLTEQEEKSHFFSETNRQQRLEEEFFQQPCINLAKALLGKVLVRRCAEGELRGRIVETESYLGGEDKASHSAGGKRTERNTAMFMKPGTIYVYPIYGIYFCMNVSSEGEGAAVLLRSVEPLQGQSIMGQWRSAKRKRKRRKLKDKDLCNGPSKLCQALNITRCFDRRDLASDPEVWLEEEPDASPVDPKNIVSAARVGIESHGEWAKKPWRFYLRGNPCVSVVDKEAEGKHESVDQLNNVRPVDVSTNTQLSM